MTTTTEAGAAGDASPTPFAGFWRRVGAIVIDVLLLGVIGAALGWLAFDALAALGSWGRVLGFVLAWPYFGLMNSRLAGGQTVGKRLLGLRTVGTDGALLSPPRAMLRGAVLAAPWFLNGSVTDPDLLQTLPLVMLLSLIIFGVGLGSAYLLVFSRPGRRLVHDWAAGSVVVRAQSPLGEPLVTPLWMGHRVVLGLLLLLVMALPVWMQGQMGTGDIATIVATQTTVMRQPGVRRAGVTKGWTAVRGADGASTTTYLAVQAWSDAPLKDEALCVQIARALLQRHADEVAKVDQLSIVAVYGYDIGIASGWFSRRVALTPLQWQERLR